ADRGRAPVTAPLRIGVNALALEPLRPSGARERLREGVGRAAGLLGESARVFAYVPRGLPREDLGRLASAPNALVVEAPISPGRGLARRLAASRFLAARARADALDVLETTPLLSPPLPASTRLVATVHDLRAARAPFPRGFFASRALARALRRATAVVAVSR